MTTYFTVFFLYIGTQNTKNFNEMKVPVQKLLACFYFGIFAYQISISILKYHSGRTLYQSNLKEALEIQYPSISVCTKYTFKHGQLTTQLFSNISLTEKKMLVLNSIWNKTEVFHFVNHPDMFDMRYPCVSRNDGSDPGKPCSFPFM